MKQMTALAGSQPPCPPPKKHPQQIALQPRRITHRVEEPIVGGSVKSGVADREGGGRWRNNKRPQTWGGFFAADGWIRAALGVGGADPLAEVPGVGEGGGRRHDADLGAVPLHHLRRDVPHRTAALLPAAPPPPTPGQVSKSMRELDAMVTPLQIQATGCSHLGFQKPAPGAACVWGLLIFRIHRFLPFVRPF